MYKHLTRALFLAMALVSTCALAVPGEYWEMTSKSEMSGMPFAMPEQKTKLCLPKRKEGKPSPEEMNPDKECEIFDKKISVSKSSWKFRCNSKGQLMEGTQEMSGTPDNMQSTVHMVGTDKGKKFEINQTSNHKRLGESCEYTEYKAPERKCSISGNESVVTLIYSKPDEVLDEKLCSGKKQAFCESLRKQVVLDVQVFSALKTHDEKVDDKRKLSTNCGITIEATNKALCKTFNAKNSNELSMVCPAEYKVFRENERRRSCEGREYTAKENLDKCLRGDDSEDSATNEPTFQQKKSKTKPGQIGTANSPSNPQPNQGKNSQGTTDSDPSNAPNQAADLMNAAKKFKGLFGL
jgi:hypothetical protein